MTKSSLALLGAAALAVLTLSGCGNHDPRHWPGYRKHGERDTDAGRTLSAPLNKRPFT